MCSYTDESGFDGIVPAHPLECERPRMSEPVVRDELREALEGIERKSLLIEVAMRDCYGFGSEEYNTTVAVLNACHKALTASPATSKEPGADGWLPIETCKEGEKVDLWVSDYTNPKSPKEYRITNAIKISQSMWMIGSGYLRQIIRPTHWQPLPPAPDVGGHTNG